MKKLIINILATLQIIAIIVSGIIFIILKTAMNINFFENFYSKNNLALKLDISYNKLIFYTNNLLEYLRGNTQLDSNWYSNKDILHMIDVKKLYNFSIYFAILLIILTLISLVITYIIDKDNFLYTPIKIFSKVFIIFFIIIVLLTIIAIQNFNYFWIKFHEIIFTNDLWLLDPKESNLIKMVPEEFFFELVIKIIINILIYLTSLIVIRQIVKKILKIK
ncbi:lipoprotein intramolecular transacylase Lit [Gemelliphila palaticanis]|uniref:DUF1461 domain-containing protein n=1 Tax=Gemelliphila palaticanis TaxID=81950 RepID=A0ABX2SWU4_9BACL|nr:DUF1461 domain-containing protein [Gemella palaticanis]MBF0714707.1 DUF1461 domain-containing protein [Gemella palaticanis]NYS46637.1 DUF1461 domain-containing protein [Gemella palaticanis]